MRHSIAPSASGERGSATAASFFYYLNRTGYNGLCRFNSRGEFNVPFGSYKTIGYTRDFSRLQAAFANWTFQCGDFEKLELRADDFIYADPPYDVEFTEYSQGGFSWDDQVRAAEWLARHRWTRSPFQSGHQADRSALQTAWVLTSLPEGAPAD